MANLARRPLRGPLWALFGGGVFVGGIYLLTKAFDYVNPIEGVGLLMGKKVLHRERAVGVDARLVAFMDWWEKNGPFPIMVGVDGGVRSNADQLRLYAQGRTTPGPHAGEPGYPPLGMTVTKASTVGNSAHGHRGAVDFWPVIGGKIYLDVKNPLQKSKYDQLGALIESFGLVWGGRFQDFYDGPHAEIPDWRGRPLVA